MKTVYFWMAVTGTVVPWLFFGSFISANGIDFVAFIRALFENGAAGGFSADILISSLVFWLWSFADAKNLGITKWWVIIPANLAVGLSLALPMYFYLRENAQEA